MPKYLNSPETLVFSKGSVLFNFHKARSLIYKANQAVVVEGYMDCMTLANKGVENVVAVLGTAMTPQHFKILRRVTQETILCFDNDEAGHMALKKSFDVGFPLNVMTLKTWVVPKDEAKDPDEYVQKHSIQAFKDHLNQAPSALDVVFQNLCQGMTSREAKVRKIKSDLLPTVMANEDEAQREIALQQLADHLQLSSFKILVSDFKNRPTHQLFNKLVDKQKEEENLPGLTWKVTSLHELKFIISLMALTFEQLPARLKNIVILDKKDYTLEDVLCDKVVTGLISEKSCRMVQIILDALNRFPDQCFCHIEHTVLPKDLQEDIDVLQRLIQGDTNVLNLYPAATLGQGSQNDPVKFHGNRCVFDPKNIPYVLFFLNDMKLMQSSRQFPKILELSLLCLETLYLQISLKSVLGKEDSQPVLKTSLHELLLNRLDQVRSLNGLRPLPL